MSKSRAVTVLLLVFLIGLVSGVAINTISKKSEAKKLKSQNDMLYEIGADMGTMGANFNKMYYLCRDENKALYDKKYDEVVSLYEQQGELLKRNQTIYDKYKDVSPNIIKDYQFNQN